MKKSISYELNKSNNTLIIVAIKENEVNDESKIVKELYGVINGNITLLKTIDGTYTPRQIIEEKLVFVDEK